MLSETTVSPLPCSSCSSCSSCSGSGISPGRRLRATSEGLDGECRSCHGTGHALCEDCGEAATRTAQGDAHIALCEECGIASDKADAAYADCQAGHPLARATEAGWLALDAHPTRFMELIQGEVLGPRTCSFCRSTLSREVTDARRQRVQRFVEAV